MSCSSFSSFLLSKRDWTVAGHRESEWALFYLFLALASISCSPWDIMPGVFWFCCIWSKTYLYGVDFFTATLFMAYASSSRLYWSYFLSVYLLLLRFTFCSYSSMLSSSSIEFSPILLSLTNPRSLELIYKSRLLRSCLFLLGCRLICDACWRMLELLMADRWFGRSSEGGKAIWDATYWTGV